MADITMCHGTGCPLKEWCYRHTAPKSKHRQSFFVTPPIKSAEPFECEHYWPAKAAAPAPPAPSER